jgi:transposase InsO family protein
MYLTAIIDWYSRFIVGWVLSDTLETAPVQKSRPFNYISLRVLP